MLRRLLAGAVVVLLFIIAIIPWEVKAEDPLAQLLLARIITSEVGFNELDKEGRPLNDPAAIHTVLRNRQGKGSLERIMRAYSSRATGTLPPLNARQAWVSGLSLELRAPEAWPANYPPWGAFRPMWQRRLKLSRRLLREPENPCDGEPDHWGGPMDDHRALAAGWVKLDCGPALNHFWSVPRRVPAQDT
jgi:hypothetical protein